MAARRFKALTSHVPRRQGPNGGSLPILYPTVPGRSQTVRKAIRSVWILAKRSLSTPPLSTLAGRVPARQLHLSSAQGHHPAAHPIPTVRHTPRSSVSLRAIGGLSR